LAHRDTISPLVQCAKYGAISSPSLAAMEISTFSRITLYGVVAGGDAE